MKPAGVGTVRVGVETVIVVIGVVTVETPVSVIIVLTISIIDHLKKFPEFWLNKHTRQRFCADIGFSRGCDDNRGCRSNGLSHRR